MSIYGLTPDQQNLYNRAVSGAMTPPPAAVTKKGRTRWVEKFMVDEIKFEPDVEISNAMPGDITGLVRIALVVDPTSQPFDEQTPNMGHRHTERLYFNWSAYQREPESRRGHAMMTKMSISSFSSFVTALGFAKEDGMQPGVFIEDNLNEIIGAKVLGMVVQSEDPERGLQDEVRTFVKVGDD